LALGKYKSGFYVVDYMKKGYAVLKSQCTYERQVKHWQSIKL